MANKSVRLAPVAGYKNTLAINMYSRRRKRTAFAHWFKLDEIQQSDKLFKPGMTVVDTGAAPGGWSQYVVTQIGGTGRIIACDILPMDPIVGVDFLQGDFRDELVLKALLEQ